MSFVSVEEHERKSIEEVQANAHLIAAAPEMLEALEEAEEVITRDGVSTLYEWDLKLKELAKQISNAIAKATNNG